LCYYVVFENKLHTAHSIVMQSIFLNKIFLCTNFMSCNFISGIFIQPHHVHYSIYTQWVRLSFAPKS